MSTVKAIAGLAGTIFIAAVVAYAVSAPRNVDAAFDQEIEALGGQTIDEHMAAAQVEAARERCEAITRAAEQAWDRSMEQGTLDRDADRLDELEAQVAMNCNP